MPGAIPGAFTIKPITFLPKNHEREDLSFITNLVKFWAHNTPTSL